MKSDIVAKLRAHLANGVSTECEVVYFLAEIRKILERDDAKHRAFALWMYCHWALHVDLTYPGATRDFLKRVDDLIVNTVSGYTPDPDYNELNDSHNLFREFVYLDTFREQLRQFLLSYELPTDLCANEESWIAFAAAYAGVVEDGTLSAKALKSNSLRAVEKVVFRKGGPPIAADSLFSFIVQWDIVLKDGRICRAGFEAKAKNQMLSWGMQLIPAPATPSLPQPA